MARRTLQRLADQLVEFAQSLPGAYLDFPWNERVSKVNKKVFVFHGSEDVGDELGFSVKLPESGADAIAMGLGTPTGYGLGRSGWVSVRITDAKAADVEMLRDWIEESYRTIAPKRLVAELDERPV